MRQQARGKIDDRSNQDTRLRTAPEPPLNVNLPRWLSPAGIDLALRWFRLTAAVLALLPSIPMLGQPVISVHPRSVTGSAGARATFSVTASSSLPMTYEWRHRNELLPDETNNVLRIQSAGLSHLGAYTVRVTDLAGSVESQPATLSLNVTVTPQFAPGLTIAAHSNAVALSWLGEGIVQAATSPAGAWTDVGGIRRNSFVSPNADAVTFYRLKNPHPRNAKLFIPSNYRPGTKLPLVFSLHRYNGTGEGMEAYVPLRPLAESEGFLYVLADGVMNSLGHRFWNAFESCCDFAGQEINDLAFFRELITLLQAEYDADPKRIHFFGHSNGGFMSCRMAQEYPEMVASIASLAGGMDRVSSLPPPSRPVSVLEIHGTTDSIIPYAGGKPTTIPGLPSDPAPVTGARESIERWAQWNGCSGLQDDGEPSLDLDSALPGLDTVVTKTANCTDGISAELWTINGANHFPAFTLQFASELVSWLLNHPKP